MSGRIDTSLFPGLAESRGCRSLERAPAWDWEEFINCPLDVVAVLDVGSNRHVNLLLSEGNGNALVLELFCVDTAKRFKFRGARLLSCERKAIRWTDKGR